MRIFIRDVMSNPRWEQSCIMSAGRERDPKVFNPPLVGWIQTPIQIRFRGGQTQVRWIQGRVDSENIARYSHTWKRWIAYPRKSNQLRTELIQRPHKIFAKTGVRGPG